MAFWDVLARAAEQPVVQLMGGVPSAIPAYDSYGIIDPTADENDILRSYKPDSERSRSSSAMATSVRTNRPCERSGK